MTVTSNNDDCRDSSSRLTTTLTVRGDRVRHQCADDPGPRRRSVHRRFRYSPAECWSPTCATSSTCPRTDTPGPARRLAQHLGNIVRAATYRAPVRRHPEGHPAGPADRRGPRDPLSCPQGRASSTRLNGVSVARRKRREPASAAIAPSRARRPARRDRGRLLGERFRRAHHRRRRVVHPSDRVEILDQASFANGSTSITVPSSASVSRACAAHRRGRPCRAGSRRSRPGRTWPG